MAFNSKVRSASGEVCLFVDKKCEKLLYNIYNLKYKEGSSKIDVPTYQQIKQSKELKFLSHPMDAASYLVDFYWPITLQFLALKKGKIMETFVEYSPIIIVVLMFFVQQKIFVTPEQLEKKHREIIEEIEEKFVTMNSFIDLKEQFSEIKDKIDKIYDLLIDLK